MGRGALYKTQRERSVLRGEGVAQVVKGDKGPAWRGVSQLLFNYACSCLCKCYLNGCFWRGGLSNLENETEKKLGLPWIKYWRYMETVTCVGFVI